MDNSNHDNSKYYDKMFLFLVPTLMLLVFIVVGFKAYEAFELQQVVARLFEKASLLFGFH